MASCRQRKTGEEVEITSLIACSESQLMWPLARFHARNVLNAGDSIWNSGRFAPTAIRLKLADGPQYVTRIEMQTEMNPARAYVHHEINAGMNSGSMRTYGCLKGPASHGAWIRVAVNAEVQLLEIATISSPSYVAWRRIRVFGKI
jgi:hypothetical protein